MGTNCFGKKGYSYVVYDCFFSFSMYEDDEFGGKVACLAVFYLATEFVSLN